MAIIFKASYEDSILTVEADADGGFVFGMTRGDTLAPYVVRITRGEAHELIGYLLN